MAPEILIRSCTPADADALALVGQATFLETFAGVLDGRAIVAHCRSAHSAALYAQWLANPAYGLWLAETAAGAAPVGFMVVAPADLPLADLSGADVELKRIYLLSKFQGAGTGSAFIGEALRHARTANAARLLLGVYTNNHAAVGFYERHGFTQVGTRRFNVGGRDYDDRILGRALVHTDPLT